MAKKKSVYVCGSCGYESPKWMGRCPGCGEWNTMIEEKQMTGSGRKGAFQPAATSYQTKPTPLKDVETIQEARLHTGIGELDRVLGGGIVPGSLVLIGGDPGIGKSTLLLQVSAQLTNQQQRVLYISGEESMKQTKLRAHRLEMPTDELIVYSETNLHEVIETIAEINPSFVVVDSIQTMFHPEVTSAPGSVSQVRECTSELMRIAKTKAIAIFIVGHVTKEGAIAGPRLLEHMVDTVLYFEGERHHSYRMVRAVKNRFGSTNEMGIFDMKESGLHEVENPSEIFLEERSTGASGSTVVASMEGTRPLLVEIQALVSPTSLTNARRMATGIDHSRVTLLMAVLEKRVGLLLQNQDAYLKAAGGVKLDEPAIDLAVAVSIASSFQDTPTQPHDCFIGEVGLTGEIRRVSRIEGRLNEAYKLGFRRVIMPKNNLDGIRIPDGLRCVGVSTVKEALQAAFS
ncbi:DNA repair protein RadA [Bacillus fonticola]|uniref:DNA repair protein RadA n=1 Tax=Bacillus fonticola TaxID=2728853 RepID=UPI001473330B|nr:DNA repair protein RadA [Bacillus fonticola]